MDKLNLSMKTKPGLEDVPWAYVFLLIGAVISIGWSLYFASRIMSIPYEIGFREGQPQVLTQMLLRGENPYIFANQPLGYYVYGIGYNAVVLPFAKIFGNTIHIHRLVTFMFILLSTTTGFWIVFRQRRKIPLALVCSAFIMIAFMGWGGLGSAPTSMGTFLFLMALFIPYIRSFDSAGLVISAVFSLLAFHTKAYFVLSFGIVAMYLFLFVSKKKALRYGALFLILFGVSFALIRIVFPLYFIFVIYGNASNTFRTFERLYTQLFWLAVYFSPALILTAIMFWGESGENKKTSGFSDFTRARHDIFDIDRPFFEMHPDYFLYAFIMSLLAFVVILGSHVGNYLAYSYEMVVPTFLFWFLINYDQKKVFQGFSAAAILLNLFCWQYITLNPQMLDQRNATGWEKLFAYIKPSMNILNSPVVTSRMVELGMLPVDGGQTDVSYLMKPYPFTALMGPPYEEYHKNDLEYTKLINDSIKRKSYDLIITTKDVTVFYDLDLIAKNYKLINQLILYMPQTEQKWVAQVWEPIK